MRNERSSVVDGSVAKGWSRWAPLTGIGFVICFIGCVTVSNVPADNAPDKDWVAAYAGKGNEFGHVLTGYLLVFAGLFLLAFMHTLWSRIKALRQSVELSILPVVAAGVSAACMGVGGVLMAAISWSERFSSMPEPNADLLRFANDLGFGMVGVAGMLAAALCIALLSVQAYSVGLVGRGMQVFGFVVAALLLAAVTFVPIVALLIWLIVMAITLMRSSTVRAREPLPATPLSAS